MSLKEADRIKIFGWPMLAGLEDGKTYQIKLQKSKEHPFTKELIPYIYELNIVKSNGELGTKAVRHYAKNVDLWVKEAGHQNGNRIEVISSSGSTKVEVSPTESIFSDNQENQVSLLAKNKLSADNVKIGGVANDFIYLLTQRLDRFASINSWKAKGMNFKSDEEEENFSFFMDLNPNGGDYAARQIAVEDLSSSIELIKRIGWGFDVQQSVSENHDGSISSVSCDFSNVTVPSVLLSVEQEEGGYDNNITLSIKQGGR